MWIGWLDEYPDYRTQGETLTDLKVNLKEIFEELTSGQIPGVRKVGWLATEVELLRRNHTFLALLDSLKQDQKTISLEEVEERLQ